VKIKEEGGYYTQKNIKTGEITVAPSFHGPEDKRVRVKCQTC
jgi:hypothetical protein